MTKYTRAVNIVEANGETIEILQELKDIDLKWTTKGQDVDGVKVTIWCGVKLGEKRRTGVNHTLEFTIERLAEAFVKTLNGNPIIENTVAHLKCEMQAVRLEAAEEMRMFLDSSD